MIIKGYMVPHPPVILPEIGRGEERKCEATVRSFHMMAEEIAALKPELLIFLTPHAAMYRDWFDVSDGTQAEGDFGAFRCPQLKMEAVYDTEWISVLESILPDGFPAGTEYHRERELDHGTMVPLRFISGKYSGFRIVRIGMSGLPLTMHYQLGMYIRKACSETGRKAVIIASGDLSHCQKKDGPYGYRPEGPAYDKRIMEVMGTADFGELFSFSPAFLRNAMECGHRPFVMMAGAFDGISVVSEAYSHEAPFGVGYGVCAFTPGNPDQSRAFLDREEQRERKRCRRIRRAADPYAALAYETVRNWVMHRIMPEEPAAMKSEKAAVFVSLHRYGELRGCIGTYLPVQDNIAREIIRNAVSACSADPRFPPVTKEELPFLEITVDVLGSPERIQDVSALDVRKYGLICSTEDGRRGLLLPDLEGVDTAEKQIRIACRKGGIDPDCEIFAMERFEAVRHA